MIEIIEKLSPWTYLKFLCSLELFTTPVQRSTRFTAICDQQADATRRHVYQTSQSDNGDTDSVRCSWLTLVIVIALLCESMKVGSCSCSGQIMNYILWARRPYHEHSQTQGTGSTVTVSRWNEWTLKTQGANTCIDRYLTLRRSWSHRSRPSVERYITGTMRVGEGWWRWSYRELISHLWHARQAF